MKKSYLVTFTQTTTTTVRVIADSDEHATELVMEGAWDDEVSCSMEFDEITSIVPDNAKSLADESDG